MGTPVAALFGPSDPALHTCAAGSVERVAGVDRFATAASVAGKWNQASTVFLATGLNFPDAMAAGPAAAAKTGRGGRRRRR